MEVKKKKVYINGRFLTQPVTGVQRTAGEMVKALDGLTGEGLIDKKEFEIIVIAPKKGHPVCMDLKHIQIIQKGRLGGIFWEQLELPFYTFGKLLISMGFVSSLLKRKQMIVVHDAATFSHPFFFKFKFRLWYKIVIWLLSKTARHIITVSQYSKEQLMKYCSIAEKGITVIYNSADHIRRFREPEDAFKKKVETLKPFLLGVSSLHPHKNFESLSKAIEIANLKNYRVVIAGGANLKSFKRIVLGSEVAVLGYITNEQLKYLYTHASLFVFPSLFEGFGIPPLEAMTMGCPVLASCSTAIPETLGNACEYFDGNNTDDLVQKLESLTADPGRLKDLQIKGYERAALYNWKRSAMQMFGLIKKYA